MLMEIKMQFAWYDFWIGIYYDRKEKTLYFCPLPMVVFSFRRNKQEIEDNEM